MAERPINLHPHEVIGIQAGRLTQLRRVVKPQPQTDQLCLIEDQLCGICPDGTPVGDRPCPKRGWLRCPFGVPGGLLWVRETWAAAPTRNLTKPSEMKPGEFVEYRATYPNDSHFVWRPSIHMPRWASRFALPLVGVRVERLQAITEADAKDAGVIDVDFYPDECSPLCVGHMLGPDDGKSPLTTTRVLAFARHWDTLDKRHPWESNPWVWVGEVRKAVARG